MERGLSVVHPSRSPPSSVAHSSSDKHPTSAKVKPRLSPSFPAYHHYYTDHAHTHLNLTGLGMWNGVHVQDLANLLMILMDDARSESPKAPHGQEGYYFCATDTYQWKEFTAEVGKKLHAKGVISTPEPRTVTDAEEKEIFGAWSGFAYASNCKLSFTCPASLS